MVGRITSTIVCSSYFTICITHQENVCSWGNAITRAHGHEEKHVFPPKIISLLKNIKSIVASDIHAVCLDDCGSVFALGNHGIECDTFSKTHIPHKVNLPPCTQISCGNTFTICLSQSGMLYSFGVNGYGELGIGNNEIYNSPQLISSLKDVEFIECGVRMKSTRQ